MTDGPDDDRPGAREVLDVRVAGRPDALVSFVRSGADTLTVTVGVDDAGRRVRLDPGTALEVLWQTSTGPRALPAELVEVAPGDDPRWVLRPLGPAATAQRRDAVRAPLRLPVELLVDDVRLAGETLDLSETGLRCRVRVAGAGRTSGLTPHAAARVTLSLGPGDLLLQVEGWVHRVTARTDRQAVVALAFAHLPERDADHLRARVFTELRVLRSRGALLPAPPAVPHPRGRRGSVLAFLRPSR